MSSANRTNRSRQAVIPLGLSLICLLYYAAFLVQFGEMFYKGSDIVANTAYAMTMFTEILKAGWAVPKPGHMLLFGSVYWLTRDLWFVHLTLIVATALTVWAGCRLILRHYDSPVGCIAFCAFLMMLPSMFGTTLAGGPGCVNVMFLLLAIVCVDRIDGKVHRMLVVVFLSLANLMRPDSWPSTYLIILLVLTPRLFGTSGPRFTRADFLFLIPMAMPFVWVLLNWGLFGDPLYSINIVKAFGKEYLGGDRLLEGQEAKEVAGLLPREAAFFLPRVQSAFFDLFSVPAWFSTRAAVLVVLLAAGIVTMVRKQPRTFLLIACPLVGTLLFYLVYALRGIVFRFGYIYTAYVCVALIVSVGLGALCGLGDGVRPRPVARFLQAAVAGVFLLFLVAGPFQQKIMDETIPELKGRAAVSSRTKPAIESLVNDVKRTGGTPIILTSGWVPPSKVALALSTGRGTFSIERLIARELLSKEPLLPELAGRTVYFCLGRFMPPKMTEFVKSLMDKADSREIIYDKDGIVVHKCFYRVSPAKAG